MLVLYDLMGRRFAVVSATENSMSQVFYWFKSFQLVEIFKKVTIICSYIPYIIVIRTNDKGITRSLP